MAVLPLSQMETTCPITTPITPMENGILSCVTNNNNDGAAAAVEESTSASSTTKKRSRNRRRRRGGTRSRSNSSGNLSDGDSSSTSSCTSSVLSLCSSNHGSDNQRTPTPKTKKNKQRTQHAQSAVVVEVPLSQEEKQQYLAMDCEMVGVGYQGTRSALARVTIVDWDGLVVYDEFVQPNEPVTDYRTFVSGITASDLEQHGLDWETCRAQVRDLLKGSNDNDNSDIILVGHALKNDLQALRLTHPWQQVRDTAKYEPFMQVRFDDGVLWPRKLRHLAAEQLDKQVQLPGQSHSAYEDAFTALQLYQKVRAKWEKVMQYKISKTAEIVGGQSNPNSPQPVQ